MGTTREICPGCAHSGTISSRSTELSRWLKGRHPHCTRGPTNAPPLGARLLLEPAQVLRPAFGRNWNLAGTPHLRTTRTMSESCSAKCRCLRQSSYFTSDHGRPSSTILQDHPSEALVVPGQEPLAQVAVRDCYHVIGLVHVFHVKQCRPPGRCARPTWIAQQSCSRTANHPDSGPDQFLQAPLL
jgi:hypothetical protein